MILKSFRFVNLFLVLFQEILQLTIISQVPNNFLLSGASINCFRQTFCRLFDKSHLRLGLL